MYICGYVDVDMMTCGYIDMWICTLRHEIAHEGAHQGSISPNRVPIRGQASSLVGSPGAAS